MTFSAYETSSYSGTPERLFLFTSGNRQWAYVHHAKPVTRGAIVFQPEIIYMDNIVQNLGEGPPAIDISLSTSAEVMQQFIPYQPIHPMSVSVFRRHRDDPDGEYLIEMMGDVASSSFDEEQGIATLQCRMTSSNTDRKVPWLIYQAPCNYALYGKGCRVNPELYKIETTAGEVVGSRIRASAFASKEDGWLTAGFVRKQGSGEVRFIIDHVGEWIELQAPFIDMEPGDALSAYAGCDRTYDTCVAKFNNGRRFLGFEWIPQKNPFKENVYGNWSSGSSGSAAGSTGGGRPVLVTGKGG